MRARLMRRSSRAMRLARVTKEGIGGAVLRVGEVETEEGEVERVEVEATAFASFEEVEDEVEAVVRSRCSIY